MVPLALEGFAVTGAIFTLVLSTTGGVVIQRALGRPYSWRVLLALMGAAVGGALVAQTWLIIAAGFRELSGPWLSVPFLSPWLILGGGMGFGQWLILRRHGSRSLFWPLVCSLGIVVLLPIGYAFTVYGLAPAHATFGTLLWDLARLTLGSAISGLAYGAITGLALLWIFRNPRVLQTTTEDKFTHEE
ncbi:MAG: hypothetical protein HY532_08835 [Chloroflexi bacterium]|nr:hypothetical protein [Chloroflexota bacterium]